MPVVVGTPPGIVASGYSRSAVKIPTSGMACWWDATDPGMFSYGNGTDPANPPNLYVSEWRDQSGAGNHAVASLNQAFQPRRNGSINGLPAVNYSGDGAYNTIGKGLSVPAWLSQTTKPISHFVLFRTGPTIYAGAHLIGGDGAVAVRFTATGVEMLINGVASWATTNGVISPNSNYLLTATYSATGAWELRINGTGSTGLNDYAVRPGFTGALGSSSDQGGSSGAQIGEAIVYNRVLSGSEIATVEAYLDKKWGGGFLPLPFPLTIPWHSAFWASDPKWSKPADGGAVPSWRNAGTSASDAVQATGTSQPTYSAAYANLNSKPAVVFDGVNDFLQSTSAAIGQPNHIVVVGWADATRPPIAGLVDSSSDANRNLLRNNADGSAMMYAGGGITIAGGGRTGPFVMAALFNQAASQLRTNGTSYTVPADPGSRAIGSVRLSGLDGGSEFKGAIAFVGVCDRALTAAEIEDLENWARAFYGVPVTPPFPATGLQGWWDASDDSSFDVGLGGAVPVWRDKSGNSRHATAPANMVPYRTGTRNGREVVTYYNTTHRGAAPVTTAVDNYTIFAVGYSSDQSSRFMFYNGDNGSANGYGPTHSYGGKVGWLHGGVVWGDIGTPSPAVGSWNVFAHQRAAGVTTGYVNGVAGPTTSTGAPNVPTNGFSISGSDRGTGGLWLGDIAEIIVYDRALSAAERNQVQGYLQTKWGTPIAPGATTGLAGWYDAADASTMTVVNTNQITQWNDKSPKAAHATAAAYAGRRTNGSINGVPAIIDDNGGGIGLTTAPIPLPSVVGINGQDCMNFAVVMFPPGSTLITNQLYGGWGTYRVVSMFDSATGFTLDVGNNTAGHLGATVDQAIGVPYLVASYRSGSKMEIFVNGVQKAVRMDAAGPVPAGDNFAFTIGGSYAKRVVGEVLHVARYDPTDFAGISQYLSDKWAITPLTAPGLQGWWDASDTSTFTYSDGADPANPPEKYVSQWRDKSGLAHHAAAEPGAHHVDPHRDGTINGLGVLSFAPNPTNVTAPTAPKSMQVATISTSTTKPSTYFMVIQFPATLIADGYLMGNVNGVLLSQNGAGVLTISIPNVAALGGTPNGTVVGGGTYLLSCSYSSAGYWIRCNGVQRASGALGTPVPTGTQSWGISGFNTIGANSSQGRVGEILCYNAALSQSAVADIERYLKKKWGTT